MKNLPPISIIIPTLNEADFIGYLLYSLSRQTYKNFEVIISDGNSTDQTKDVAKDFARHFSSLSFVASQKRSPATQRNNGAKSAKHEQLLFLDADVVLPPDFLEKSLKEIIARKLDFAHPTSFPLTKRIIDQYIYFLTNWSLKLAESVFPLAGGYAIFAKKSFHEKMGGFDERITNIAEDVDYVSRAAKNGWRFGIINSSSPYISVRRLDKEGRASILKNLLTQSLIFSIFGKYDAQKFLRRSYGDFGTFTKILNEKKARNALVSHLNKEQFNRFISFSKRLFKTIWE